MGDQAAGVREGDLIGVLRERGVRVTSPRLAVLRAVGELHDHPSVEAIAVPARERGCASTSTRPR